MKNLTLLCFIIVLAGCTPTSPEEITVDSQLTPTLNCESLILDFSLGDDLSVENVLNHLCEAFPDPEPNQEDEIGHLENTKMLVDLLNECAGIKAELNCYACAKSLPPQTLIRLAIQTNGTTLHRDIHIYAPDEDKMFVADL
jgi:hypothetical protein